MCVCVYYLFSLFRLEELELIIQFFMVYNVFSVFYICSFNCSWCNPSDTKIPYLDIIYITHLENSSRNCKLNR